jgi:hypothetical protein
MRTPRRISNKKQVFHFFVNKADGAYLIIMKFPKHPIELMFRRLERALLDLADWYADPFGISRRRTKRMNEEIVSALSEYYRIEGKGSWKIITPKRPLTPNEKSELESKLDEIRAQHTSAQRMVVRSQKKR